MAGRPRGAPDLPPGPGRELADLFRRLRGRCRLSVGQIAVAAGRSRGHTCEVINGWKHPSPDTAEAIARAMGADLAVTAKARHLAEDLAELTSYQRTARGSDVGIAGSCQVGRPRRLQSATSEPSRADGPCSGLPPESAHFHGRQAELEHAVALLCGPSVGAHHPVVCAVSGMAGVGKTAFAVRIANTIADRFADGCLFLDLHGYTGAIPPLSHSEAADSIMRRLGLPGDQIPVSVDERIARLRQLLSGKQILIILDNALNSDQVEALLPASAHARVLITSRCRLVSLDDARHLCLRPLSGGEAQAVFSSVAGTQLAGSGRYFRELVDACGGVPLALRILAARCREGSPGLLAEIHARMADEQSLLDEIDDGERGLAAAFAITFDALPESACRLFALLGLYPGGDWTAYAAAAMADLTLTTAARGLDRLANAHLVERDWNGRYFFHDLVRVYAGQQAMARISEQERAMALQRLFTWARDALTAADTLITPHRYRSRPTTANQLYVGPRLRDFDEAVAWVASERANLVELCRRAATLQADPFSWQIAFELRGFFFLAKQWDDWLSTHQAALTDAIRAGNLAAEALTRNNLGLALMETSHLDLADEQFMRARQLFANVGDEHGVNNALANHAAVLYYRAEFQASLRLNESAYAFYQRHGSARNAAITLRSIALNNIELGDFGAAVAALEVAVQSFVELNLPLDEAMAMNCLGEAHLRGGDSAEAARWSLLALDRSRSCSSSYERARAYRNLGRLAAAAGQTRQASAFWQQALSIYGLLRAPQADAVQASLAELANRSARRQGATRR